jgi:hypothetical protein
VQRRLLDAPVLRVDQWHGSHYDARRRDGPTARLFFIRKLPPPAGACTTGDMRMRRWRLPMVARAFAFMVTVALGLGAGVLLAAAEAEDKISGWKRHMSNRGPSPR